MSASPPVSNPTPIAANALPAEEAWAAEVAAGLRLILAAAADEPKADREQSLEEVVRAKLAAVAPAQRARYLERLTERFPTGQFAPPPTPAATNAPTVTPLGSPDEVVRVITEAWGRFTTEQREALRQRLAQAGIAAAAAEGADSGATVDLAEVRQRLGLAAGETVSLQRLGRLCVQQMEFLGKLDQLAWNTWKTLAPHSRVKRESAQGDMRVLTRRYLKGEADLTDLQMAQQIERTRQLIAILLGSISQVGRGFAKRHQTRYAPEAIQDLVKLEGGGGWSGAETKCWRKYAELAAEINEATIQNEMQEVVVKYVEDLIRGTAKSGG